MGQYRHAAGERDGLHGRADLDGSARDEVALSLAQIAVERVIDALGKAQLHQDSSEMRAADGFAEALLHPGIVHRQAVGRHENRHLLVALVPILDNVVQQRDQILDIIAEYMHRNAVSGADLDAGHHLDAVVHAGGQCLGMAGNRVVVGDRNAAQAQLRCAAHGLPRRTGAVGSRRMYMQVKSSHEKHRLQAALACS